MNTSIYRWSTIVFLIVLFAGLSSGCVVSGGDGYGYSDGGGIAVDYYEPSGASYGGWAPNYYVGPVRGGYHGPVGGPSSSHAYRSASVSHSMPSIPSNSRSGGSRRR